MEKKYKIAEVTLVATIAAIVTLLPLQQHNESISYIDASAATSTPTVKFDPLPEVLEVEILTPKLRPILTPEQDAWRDKLEMCESGGVNTAINPVDKDGTPSYYAFQFKPGTFRGYGEQYGVIPKGLTPDELMEALKVYGYQKSIVGHMILDPRVNWYQQFPDCVRKHGLPPQS